MKSAALYIRVSKGEQNPETQLLQARDYARRRECSEIIEYVDHGWSGSKRKRPALDALMKDAKAKRFDAVIVVRFDRFARSLHDLICALEEFEARQIDFISLHEAIDTTTPMGRLMFSLAGAFAEFEHAIIRERIMDGLERAKAEGKQLGRPKKIFDRQKVLRLGRKGESVRKIAKKLGLRRETVRLTLKSLTKNHLPQF
jgi:DNA invertase Pin-like site-specific DNA recombinase